MIEGQIASCAVAFKEWAGVVEALADGRQSIIVRKGGIAEGPSGFRPEHTAFWLYPTHVHEAAQGLRPTTEEVAIGTPALRIADPTFWATTPTLVPLEVFVVVEECRLARHVETLRELEHLHIWTRETVRKRFDYREPGLWVLGVRAYRGAAPVWIEATPDNTSGSPDI